MTSQLDNALLNIQLTEANLVKLENLWDAMKRIIPTGPAFLGDSPEAVDYDDKRRAFREILNVMPTIGDIRIEDHLLDLDTIGQMRIDALEVEEFSAQISTDSAIYEQGNQLRNYRFHLKKRRRQIVRKKVEATCKIVDERLKKMKRSAAKVAHGKKMPKRPWEALKKDVDEIDRLLGDVDDRAALWGSLHRHLGFGEKGDFVDIEQRDWPQFKAKLKAILYSNDEPHPVEVGDLSELGENLNAIFQADVRDTRLVNREFISKQIENCDSRLSSADYDGAITTSRALLEAVLVAVATQLSGTRPEYGGDLPKLYKVVRKLLESDLQDKATEDSIARILGGLTNVVEGLAHIRNAMSDAHSQTVKPEEHHARLAVNAAKTVSDFVYAIYEASQET